MSIDTLLSDFEDKRTRKSAFERLAELARTDQISIDRFAETALSRFPGGGTFFDFVLGYVTRDTFERLVATAVDSLNANAQPDAEIPAEIEAAEAVIAYASLQFPDLLGPHLSKLFKLRPNRKTYYENWPWRGAGSEAHAELIGIIQSSSDQNERTRAWLCLLELRSDSAFADAASLTDVAAIAHPAQGYLREVGYDSPATPLYNHSPWHLIFEKNYFNDSRPAWMSRDHSSWNLSGDHEPCRFGGYAPGKCGLCAGPLHHLMTLPEAFSSENLASTTAINLSTCLSCLGWEKHFLSYTHGAEGLPESISNSWPHESREGEAVPEFPAVALKEGIVRLTATPARWRWQDWALSNGRENLNRVGGFPSWIQSAEYPECPSCKTPMRFLLQLDSDLPSEDDEEWSWGSGGICYGFWCAPCRISGFYWQCT